MESQSLQPSDQRALASGPTGTQTCPSVRNSVAAAPQAHGVAVNHGIFIQAGRDATTEVHHHHYNPEPMVDILFILRLVNNLRQVHQDNLSKATPGTGVWLLVTREFILWLDLDGHLKILWGTGIPGAGKTVLASIVINHLETRAEAAGGKLCVAYIYFRYTDGTETTVRDALEILVKQIVERHQDCASLAREAYSRHTRESTQPTEAELLQLLQRFTGTKSATFYILDALDEAPVRLQVDLVKKLASLEVRLFITSRPLKAVEARVPEAHSFQIIARDEDISRHISAEISRSRDLQHMLETSNSPITKEVVVSTVTKNCNGMFLLASLQLRELCECASTHEAMEVLKGFPTEIEEAYLRTWDRILKQRTSHVAIAKAILLWVLYASRPMTISELERAVATHPTTYKFETDRMMAGATLMTICCGLVTIEEESQLVLLVHYTAKDILQKLLEETWPHPHFFLTAVCITHLTRCGFQNTDIEIEEKFIEARQEDPLLAYASDGWASHAQESLATIECKRQIVDFISKCKAFPICPRSDPYFDILSCLHILAFYNFPLSLLPQDDVGDPNAATRIHRTTPLIFASLNGHAGMVQDLLRLQDIRVNLVDGLDGGSALQWAASRGHEAVVRLLLEHPDIDVNLADEAGLSALLEAATKGHKGIAEALLAHPDIQVNLVDSFGWSALLRAANYGHGGIVELLLSRPEIQVNLEEQMLGFSALMKAAHKGHEDIVRLLLAHPKIEVSRSMCLQLLSAFERIKEGENGVLRFFVPALTANIVNMIIEFSYSIAMSGRDDGPGCMRVTD